MQNVDTAVAEINLQWTRRAITFHRVHRQGSWSTLGSLLYIPLTLQISVQQIDVEFKLKIQYNYNLICAIQHSPALFVHMLTEPKSGSTYQILFPIPFARPCSHNCLLWQILFDGKGH